MIMKEHVWQASTTTTTTVMSVTSNVLCAAHQTWMLTLKTTRTTTAP